MKQNPLIDLENFGQSIWLDYISRSLLSKGDLADFIRVDHLKGVTSNPSIFEKAIAKTNDYDDIIASSNKKELTPFDVYESLAIKDIQGACDLLRPVFEASQGKDGFACLEVSPRLAYDATASIEEGRRLWHRVDRPNLMVKIPGTKEGMAAIRTLIADGINVNVTLLFSVASYEDAALAYLHGLKDRSKRGLPISSIQSVASFFISRIDSKVDALCERIIASSSDDKTRSRAEALIGRVAIANAKLAYLRFIELYKTDLAKTLVRLDAQPQRLLWASTSTKNPRFSDVYYVETLIGAQTVNTLPLETMVAFRNHGKTSNSLMNNIHDAFLIFENLADLNLNFSALCEELQSDGIKLFENAFDQLLKAVEHKLSLKSVS